MRTRRLPTLVFLSALAIAGAIIGGRSWSIAHARRWTGRPNLGFVTCNHCHLQRLGTMPWAKPRPRHAAPSGLAVAPNGTILYVALDDLNQILELDSNSQTVRRRLDMPGSPFGLTVDSSGRRVYVACRDSDKLVAVDAQEFKPVESISVGEAPVALAFCRTKAGDRLIVANSVSDNISVLALDPFRELARPQAGREPYAVAVASNGSVAFVANRLAVPENSLAVPESELTLLEPSRGRIIARKALVSAHLAEGTTTVPGRTWSLTPLIKVRNLVPITQVASGWVMSSALAVSDYQGKIIQLPLDEGNDYFADPSGIVVDVTGRRAYVASGGSDVVTVIDLERLSAWLSTAAEATQQAAVEDLTLSAEYVVGRIPTGRNPRQLALSPDSRQLFIAERLQDSILVVDTTTLKPVGRIALGDGGLDDPIRRGERVFTRSAHTFQRQFSCRSCHPDGHVDGLAYDFDGDGIGDNLLDNRSLQGVAGTAPFKWNGKNSSLEVQCGPRFARVLMRTDPIPPDELKDLSIFLESQPPPRWERKRKKPLTLAQERGKKLFFAVATPAGNVIPRERRCQTCHRPPLFTNRLLSSVGTKSPRDTSDQFDTPHLLGLAQSGPYLHDGRAKTLEELWTTYQTNDLHGVSSYMTKQQLNDLVDYLKTL